MTIVNDIIVIIDALVIVMVMIVVRVMVMLFILITIITYLMKLVRSILVISFSRTAVNFVKFMSEIFD